MAKYKITYSKFPSKQFPEYGKEQLSPNDSLFLSNLKNAKASWNTILAT